MLQQMEVALCASIPVTTERDNSYYIKRQQPQQSCFMHIPVTTTQDNYYDKGQLLQQRMASATKGSCYNKGQLLQKRIEQTTVANKGYNKG